MRIIGGIARGRAFDAPEGTATRPTLVRVRKSVFDALQYRIPGAKVLDLFSGSGGLGLEAASRGASYVLCNDLDRRSAALIRRNAEKIRLSDRVEVWQSDWLEALRRVRALDMRFGLAFVDAPYFEGNGEKSIGELFALGLIEPGGLVVWEHDASVSLPQTGGNAEVRWERSYGDVTVTMLEETGDRG